MIEIKVLASSSAGNAYRVTDGQTELLLDAGLPIKDLRQKMNFELSSLAGVLISHSHKDHCKAVPDLLKVGTDCFMSQQTKEEGGYESHRVKILEPQKTVRIGTWTVLPFFLEHDVPNIGFLLVTKDGDKLLYATDTYYCKYTFNGLTHIMIECNHSYDILQAKVEAGILPIDHKNRLIRSHFSLENVKKFLQANDLSRVQEVWLIHLSSANSDAERFKREIQEVTGKLVMIVG